MGQNIEDETDVVRGQDKQLQDHECKRGTHKGYAGYGFQGYRQAFRQRQVLERENMREGGGWGWGQTDKKEK